MLKDLELPLGWFLQSKNTFHYRIHIHIAAFHYFVMVHLAPNLIDFIQKKPKPKYINEKVNNQIKKKKKQIR